VIDAMKTTGDRILYKPLAAIGVKGLFTRELDQALRAGTVDICVHSCKDMPTPDDPELPIVAVSRREDPRDVLLLPDGCGKPDFSTPLGTASQRRKSQLAGIYPQWQTQPVRGNIQTRLSKLDAGQYGGLVLAAAGLKRLGLFDRVYQAFDCDRMIPAAGQGVLAIQGRAGENHDYLRAVNDVDAYDAVMAERAFVHALGGGCTAPTAAYALCEKEEIRIIGFHVDADGTSVRGETTGKRAEAAAVGAALAMRLKPHSGDCHG
ncbi:MAG: hydroxymethylbilane synthase, partial [Planctomycetes bacterium]|nr:hydroxymethylbilane synthase [Planctomycetota bacterium]